MVTVRFPKLTALFEGASGMNTTNGTTAPTSATKTCKKCGKAQALDRFAGHAYTADRHLDTCRACMSQVHIESHKKRGVKGLRVVAKATPKAAHAPLPPPAPVAEPQPPSATPLFVSVGGYRFALGAISVVDTSRPGRVEVKLNVHEVGPNGYPVAACYAFEGDEARDLLVVLDLVTGRAPESAGRIWELEAEAAKMREERDTALALAGELETKQAALRKTLGL